MAEKQHTSVYIEKELLKKVRLELVEKETDLTKLVNKLLKEWIKDPD